MASQTPGLTETETSFTKEPAPADLTKLIELICTGPYKDMVDELRTSLSQSKDFRFCDASGRNILHHACERRGNKEAVLFVGRIIQRARSIEISDADMSILLNQAENQGKSPIHLALDCGDRELVNLLLSSGADVNLPVEGGKHEVIRRIYKEMPEVLVHLFDSNLECRADPRNASERMRIVTWDFTPVTRALSHHFENDERSKFHKLEPQTFHLAQTLHEGKATRSVVLCHPLVQLFLHYKQRRFRWAIWISILSHILWSFFNIYIFVSYSQYQSGYKTGNQSAQTISFEELNQSHNSSNIFLHLPLLLIHTILYMIVLCKELYEAITCPDTKYYLLQLENLGQWSLLLCVPVVWISYFLQISGVGRLFGTSGFFFSGLLVLGQLNKTECCGIHMEILVKVTKNILKFLGFFSPLILTYVLIFRLLMPGRDEFWLPGAIPKIVTMMTGEVGYDEGIHGENTNPHPGLTKFAFLCFDVTVVIVLQNVLIGLTLSDIQKLKAKAKETHLAKQLEQIYLIERFLLSCPIKWIFKLVGGQRILISLMVKPKEIEPFRLNELPKYLQKLIISKVPANAEH